MIRTPRGMLAICAVLTMVVSGCRARPEGPFPKEVVVEVETGSIRVELDPERSEPPIQVPLVSLYQGRRHDGLLLVPDTASWTYLFRVRSLGTRGARGGDYSIQQVPSAVVRVEGGAWQLRFRGSTSMTADAVERMATTPLPVQLSVSDPAIGWYGVREEPPPLPGENPRYLRQSVSPAVGDKIRNARRIGLRATTSSMAPGTCRR
jgi:hypothetical protein